MLNWVGISQFSLTDDFVSLLTLLKHKNSYKIKGNLRKKIVWWVRKIKIAKSGKTRKSANIAFDFPKK